jgi:hypothetical protein
MKATLDYVELNHCWDKLQNTDLGLMEYKNVILSFTIVSGERASDKFTWR